MSKLLHKVMFLLLLIPLNVMGMELPNLYSDKVLLYDLESEEVLFEKGADVESNIASLTKIMTTIMAIENIENLDEIVTIDWGILSEIPYDASVAGLKLGDKVSYRDLLYASILPSGADATTALAHNIAGSTKGFVELMNEKAQGLGLKHTHFANVTGYDIPNHYSTPREVLAILKYALDNPTFEEIYKTRSYKLSNGLVVQSTLNTYNIYMKLDLSSVLGSKTGYTGNAGMCMSAIIQTGGKELILITLGAPYSYVTPFNLKDTMTILNYLDENYAVKTLFQEGQELLSIPVAGSKEEEYIIKVAEPVDKYVEIDYDEENLKYLYDGLDELSYKNKLGDKIGEVRYYYMDELLRTDDVILDTSFNFSLYKFIKAHKIELGCVIGLLLVCILINRQKKKRKRRRKKRGLRVA